MLTAIAIDDEPIALEVIKSFAEQARFVHITEYFTDAFEAMEYLQPNKVDMMFLDIKMPDITGIEFVRTLPAPPLVIFTTAYSEHAVQSFEVDAIDYLLKPFSLNRFLKACNKANSILELKKNSQAQPSNQSIFIKSGYEQVRIELNDLLFAEGKGNYVQFVTAKQKILSRLTMGEAENLLPSLLFVRVHRSFIIAKAKITRIEKRSVWLDQIEIPIGSGYGDQIDRLLK